MDKLTKLDTKAFNDAIEAIDAIDKLYIEKREGVLKQSDKLLDSWKGSAKDRFKIYYDGFSEKLTMEMQLFTEIKDALASMRQAYIDADEALATSLKSEE